MLPVAGPPNTGRETNAVVRTQEGIAQINISITQAMAQIGRMAGVMSQLPVAIEGGLSRLTSQNVAPPTLATNHQTFEQLFQILSRPSMGGHQGNEGRPDPGSSGMSVDDRVEALTNQKLDGKLQVPAQSANNYF